RTEWPAGTGNHANGGNRRRDVEREVTLPDADRHVQHEIAVRAERLNRELPQLSAERRMRGIDQPEEHLTADVARSDATTALLCRQQPRLAPRREVGAVLVVAIGAERGIERTELLLAVGPDAVPHDARHL